MKNHADHVAFIWSWEQRYVVLLWLSQLLLAPFDLATISSEGTESGSDPIAGFLWPPNTPSVTSRVIPMAIYYLSSSGKERDAAKVLLARVAMRRDMQDCGIMNALIRWAISCLRTNTTAKVSPYYYIGTLSFLAAILSSSLGTTDLAKYLPEIARLLQMIAAEDRPVFREILSSAVAQKCIIKAMRTTAVLLLQNPDDSSQFDLVGNIIGYMLESLADPATPIRLAASKALSIITLKLPPDMATEVVEEVLRTFNKNVLRATENKDLSRVNPQEWHGLILTLSHLIYRRSIPTQNLSPIVDVLRLGLSFEQRSTSGASVGTNVRDAACFGFWGLARRYSTVELESITITNKGQPPVIPTLESTSIIDQGQSSVIQMLANELVVAASLDPAGNIRRGSSAALQELVGRHPDKVANGISIVQVVDYHAVALRSRAMLQVAYQAAQLSENYHNALSINLLGWRGVKDFSIEARMSAATTFGSLVWNCNATSASQVKTIAATFNGLTDRILRLEPREVEERQGLVSILSAIIAQSDHTLTKECVEAEFISTSHLSPVSIIKWIAGEDEGSMQFFIHSVKQKLHILLPLFMQLVNTANQPDYFYDAVSSLITASQHVLKADCLFLEFSKKLSSHRESNHTELSLWRLLDIDPLDSSCTYEHFHRQLMLVEASYMKSFCPDPKLITMQKLLIDNFLTKAPESCYAPVSRAAISLYSLLNRAEREVTYQSWLTNAVQSRIPGRLHGGRSYLHVIFRFPLQPRLAQAAASDEQQEMELAVTTFVNALWARADYANTESDLQTLVTIYKCLAESNALATRPELFMPMTLSGLKNYTTTERGDVGSVVRIEAVKAAAVIFGSLEESISKEISFAEFEMTQQWALIAFVLRVAAEKLDKVRIAAKPAISALSRLSMPIIYSERILLSQRALYNVRKLDLLSTSSKEYFLFLLNQLWRLSERPDENTICQFLLGYITSADTGSEDLIQASREALVDFCLLDDRHLQLICWELYKVLEYLNEHSQDASATFLSPLLVISVMEVIAFLLNYGVMQKCSRIMYVFLFFSPFSSALQHFILTFFPSWSKLSFQVNKAHYQTSNVRKLEAAIKVYGEISEVYPLALKRLLALAGHRFPGVRLAAAEELYVAIGIGKGYDWLMANKEEITSMRGKLESVIASYIHDASVAAA